MAEPKRSPWSGSRIELSGKLAASSPMCPQCDKLIDGFTCVDNDGARPIPGDTSICFYCATILEFYGEPLALRRLEGGDLIIALADPLVRLARELILAERHRREAEPHGAADG